MDARTFDGIDVPKWKCQQPLESEGAPTMQIATIGIDLAKNVFQIHGAGASRERPLSLGADFSSCLATDRLQMRTGRLAGKVRLTPLGGATGYSSALR